jgi:hypothetical protein
VFAREEAGEDGSNDKQTKSPSLSTIYGKEL